MFRRLLPVVAVSVVLSLPGAANATVFVGLQQDAGPIVTVASSASGVVNFNGAFGEFETVTISVVGQPLEPLPALLDSTAIVVNDAGAPNAGTLTVYVTSTDNTSPVADLSFASSFAVNNLTPPWIETLETYIAASNGVFATTTLLGSETFAATGSDVDTTSHTAAAPYSVTGVFRITAPILGRTNGGLTLGARGAASVPEPSVLMLLGTGLVGLYAVRRRRI